MLVSVAPGISVARRAGPGGFAISMFVIELQDGGVLLHSPTTIDDALYDEVAAKGPVRYLFAPNHFHHVFLEKYRERFPGAVPVCAPAARPRLEKKGHAGLQTTDDFGGRLGDVQVVIPEGTKNGEAWLFVERGGERTLIFCDAFFNDPGPFTGFLGWVLRKTRTGPGLQLGRTFCWLAIRDAKAYRASLESILEERRPTRVLFSHGEPIVGSEGVSRLRETVARVFD